MKFLKQIIFFGLLLLGMKLQSQQEYGTWTALSVEKSFNQWNFEAETELRTIYWMRLISRWDLGISANYELANNLHTGVTYQLMNVLDEKYLNYQIRHRFKADISYAHKISDLKFSIAEGVQLTTKDDSKRIKTNGNVDTYTINPALMWKNDIQVEYNISHFKITPGYNFETYFELNNPDGNSFDKFRHSLFFKYKLNKKNSIKLFGVYNQEKGTDQADYSGKYNLGVKFSHQF